MPSSGGIEMMPSERWTDMPIVEPKLSAGDARSDAQS
jgi:hypothetical protein